MNASILQFLRTTGDEELDIDIAKALRLPLKQVRARVSQLSAEGEIICCEVTRFIDGKKVQGTSCRLVGSLPAIAHGRKSAGRPSRAQAS